MTNTKHPNDTNQADFLTRPVRNLMEAGLDVHDSALDWSLGSLVSAHLKYDHEWARRFVDIVDILSLEEESGVLCGLGALYWAPADAIGRHESPEPLAFEIRYDPQSASLVSWYEVMLWTASGSIRLTPDGARRLVQASDPAARLPMDSFLAVVGDNEAPVQIRLAAAHMVSSRCEEGADAIRTLMGQIAEDDVEGRQACMTGIQRACWDTGRLIGAVVEALDSPDPSVRLIAAVTVWTTEVGAELRHRALPELFRGLGEDDSMDFRTARGAVIVGLYHGSGMIVRSVLADAANEHEEIVVRLIEALDDAASVSGAIDALGRVGPAARSAVNPLCDAAVKYPDHRGAVWEALCKISEDHARDLASRLFHEDEAERRFAARTFHQAEPHTARWVTQELIDALEGATLAKRDYYRVARTLATVSPRDDAIRSVLVRLTPWLAAAFAEGDADSVFWEQRVLEAIGPDAAEAVPMLARRACERGKVGYLAIKALGAIGPAAAEAVPALMTILGSNYEDRDLCAHVAIQTLTAIGPAAVRHLVPLLEWEAVEDFRGYIAGRVGGAIRDIGAAAAPVVTEMFHLDPESLPVVRALGWVGSLAVPQLLQALANEKASVRLEAARAIGRIGPDARAAIEPLARLLREADVDVAIACVLALGRIGPATAPALREALNHDLPEDVRAWALRLLGEMGL